jgi:hypothetical protein
MASISARTCPTGGTSVERGQLLVKAAPPDAATLDQPAPVGPGQQRMRVGNQTIAALPHFKDPLRQRLARFWPHIEPRLAGLRQRAEMFGRGADASRSGALKPSQELVPGNAEQPNQPLLIGRRPPLRPRSNSKTSRGLAMRRARPADLGSPCRYPLAY